MSEATTPLPADPSLREKLPVDDPTAAVPLPGASKDLDQFVEEV